MEGLRRVGTLLKNPRTLSFLCSTKALCVVLLDNSGLLLWEMSFWLQGLGKKTSLCFQIIVLKVVDFETWSSLMGDRKRCTCGLRICLHPQITRLYTRRPPKQPCILFEHSLCSGQGLTHCGCHSHQLQEGEPRESPPTFAIVRGLADQCKPILQRIRLRIA